MAILIRKQYEDALKEIEKCDIQIAHHLEILKSIHSEQIENNDDNTAHYDCTDTWGELKKCEARKNELFSYISDCTFAKAETIDKVQIGSACTIIRQDGKTNHIVFVENLINGPEYNSWTEGGQTVRYISTSSPMGKAINGSTVGEEVNYITPAKQIMTVLIDRVDNESYLQNQNQKEMSLGTHPAMH